MAETPGVTLSGAYAWANKPTDTSVYTPTGAYSYNGFGTGRLTAQNIGTGEYAIGIPGAPNFASSVTLVTSIIAPGLNNDSNFCNVEQTFPVVVACFSKTGKPVNSPFIVNFQSAQ